MMTPVNFEDRLIQTAVRAGAGRDANRHGERGRRLLFFMTVPFCCGVLGETPVDLPHGSSRAGDRHLNFYKTRDKSREARLPAQSECPEDKETAISSRCAG
jgi:hypothetical protein